MKLASAPLAITGMGVYTSLGCGVSENWEKLLQGRSGVRSISRFSTLNLPVKMAATVELQQDCLSAAVVMAREVLAQAAEQSQLSVHELIQAQLVIAAPPREIFWPLRLELHQAYFDAAAQHYDGGLIFNHQPAEFSVYYQQIQGYFSFQLQQQYHFDKLPFVLSTACASGASAIQLAAEQIRSGHSAVAIALGVESCVMPETIARFALLSTLSTQNATPEQASKPFSLDRDGFVLGEGAGALVLEDLAHAQKRGANILGYLVGCGDTTDNFHRTRSNPSGETIALCMRKALAEAQLDITQIDCINAHGTSTTENDKMESKGIQLLCGENAHTPWVTANKSMIGHTLSAAGAIEAVFSVLTLQHQIIPPTINYHQVDPDIHLNIVAHHAQEAKVNTVLSNSFGFGGQNVSLLFAKEPA